VSPGGSVEGLRAFVASTENVDISTLAASSVIDDAGLSAGDVVLLKNQTAPAENGVYVVGASAGETVRSTEADADTELEGLVVVVTSGSTQFDTIWRQTTPLPITVGTTGLVFEQAGSTDGFIEVRNDGVPVSLGTKTLNFTGSGIASITNQGDGVTDVEISGGGGSVAINNGETQVVAAATRLKFLGTAIASIEEDSENPGVVEITLNGGGAASFPQTVSLPTTMDATHVNKYLRGGATMLVQNNADEAIPLDAEVYIRATGAVTISEDTNVTINPPFGGTLTMSAGMTATLKKVGTDTWDLIGHTDPA
jgi:hypothetical protein